MSFENKIALVTGASRGIGFEIAKQLAAKGAFVIGTATSQNRAKDIQTKLEDLGYKVKGMCLDISSKENITEFFKVIKAEKIFPDILVNNAGITCDNLMMRMSEDEWTGVINTNLSSIFRMSKECVRQMMKKRWGRIISIGSIVGSSGNPGQSNYCAAKAGVIGFSKSLAYEFASRNITVNIVSPGFIKTDMTDKLTDDQKAMIMAKIPSQKMGSPADIANAVVFLASEDAAYITGQTLHVNGGMLMP